MNSGKTSMESPPEQPSKDIVSKTEYLQRQGKRTLLASLGIVTVILTLFATIFVVSQLSRMDYMPDTFIVLILVGGFIYLMNKTLEFVSKKVTSINPGIPLTRANTADLPAPDSLVRASEEPMQAQQTVLLRAATQSTETQEEQLLRASAGGQE